MAHYVVLKIVFDKTGIGDAEIGEIQHPRIFAGEANEIETRCAVREVCSQVCEMILVRASRYHKTAKAGIFRQLQEKGNLPWIWGVDSKPRVPAEQPFGDLRRAQADAKRVVKFGVTKQRLEIRLILDRSAVVEIQKFLQRKVGEAILFFLRDRLDGGKREVVAFSGLPLTANFVPQLHVQLPTI